MGRFYSLLLQQHSKLSTLNFNGIISVYVFQAEILSGVKITSLASAEAACRALHGLGPRICILKGLQFSDDYGSIDEDKKQLSVVLSVAGEGVDRQGIFIRIDVPKIEGKFSGCGDLFTAMCGGISRKQYISLISAHLHLSSHFHFVLLLLPFHLFRSYCPSSIDVASKIDCRNRRYPQQVCPREGLQRALQVVCCRAGWHARADSGSHERGRSCGCSRTSSDSLHMSQQL